MMRRSIWIVGVLIAALWLAYSRSGMSASNDAQRREGGAVRVEVLNGSGIARAGLDAAEDLRASGFDVVDIRNADRSDYEETIVLDRVGVSDYAESVSHSLGVGEPCLQRNDDLLLEVTVILGRDLALRKREGRS
ncbi:MAG TPA: LytR C-terminal domain-containing protein [bacterium]|nr:LytR C-terminal domain-containing protein [bacterium]